MTGLEIYLLLAPLLLAAPGWVLIGGSFEAIARIAQNNSMFAGLARAPTRLDPSRTRV
jgi:hypothetical protein